MNKDFENKKEKCTDYFNVLCELLKESYEQLGSCNLDFSRYLCPIGTANEVSYTSKPDLSFRISDHWNWYANTRKCPNEHYIQCYSKDLPWALKRKAVGMAGNPRKAACVCL